jgi:hypothetical protein
MDKRLDRAFSKAMSDIARGWIPQYRKNALLAGSDLFCVWENCDKNSAENFLSKNIQLGEYRSIHVNGRLYFITLAEED